MRQLKKEAYAIGLGYGDDILKIIDDLASRFDER
jgi:hypothetical protein